MSPFRAMYGYDPKIRFDVTDDVPKEEIPAARVTEYNKVVEKPLMGCRIFYY